VPEPAPQLLYLALITALKLECPVGMVNSRRHRGQAGLPGCVPLVSRTWKGDPQPPTWMACPVRLSIAMVACSVAPTRMISEGRMRVLVSRAARPHLIGFR
jgi:hypothetical protein